MIWDRHSTATALRIAPGFLVLAAIHPLSPYLAGLLAPTGLARVVPVELAIELSVVAAIYVLALLAAASVRRAGSQAAASEGRFRKLVDSLPVGVAIGSGDGRIALVNPACTRIYGLTAGEAPAFDWRSHIPPESLPDFEAARRARDQGRFEPFETEILRTDGSLLPIRARVVPIDERLGAMVFEDLTERRQRDEAIRQAAEVEHGRRAALDATREKSRFLAQLSHELRTPLNAISGFTDVLLSGRAGPLAGRQADYLGYVMTSARHLRALVDTVLDLSQVEAGKLTLRLEPADPAPLVDEVRDLLAQSASAKGIVVGIDVAAGLPEIVTDAARFKQILLNLLSNAIKFTPAGRRVAVRLVPTGSSEFRLEVEDEGIGISEHDRERLFKEFERLDSSQVGSPPGSGLGLAITGRIALAMGGSVEVRSTPGHGSTFSVTLPVRVNRPPGSSGFDEEVALAR